MENDKLTILQDCVVYLQSCIEFDANESIASIDFIDNAQQSNAQVHIECRWSLDNGVNWSLWQPLSLSIADFNEFVIAHFQQSSYELLIQFKLSIDWLQNWRESQVNEIAYVLESITINDVEIPEIECCIDNTAPTDKSITINSEDKLWKPYDNMSSAVDIWRQMMQATNKQIGHTVIWFSHDALEKHRIASLRSFERLHAGDVKFLQIMVVDNNFNVAKVTYDAFDVDFEQGIDIHILPEEYEKVFGTGRMPQQHDYFYAPVANRMFEIIHVQSTIGLMNVKGWYECRCNSYEIRTDLIEHDTMNVDDNVQQLLLDNDIESVQDLVKPMQTFDKAKATNEQVATAALNMIVTDTHIDLTLFDAYRKWVHHSIISVPTKLYTNNNTIPVSSAYYDMSKAQPNEIAVQYIKELPDTEWSYAMWFYVNEDGRYSKQRLKQLCRVGDFMLIIFDGILYLIDATEVQASNQYASLSWPQPDADKPLSIKPSNVMKIVQAQSNLNINTFIKLCKVNLQANVWYQVILRTKQLDDMHIELNLQLFTTKQLGVMTQLALQTESTIKCVHSLSAIKDIQLYTFNGFATHIRLEPAYNIAWQKLLCSEQPYESTIIADDATQIEIAGRQIINGCGNWSIVDPNIKQQVSASSDWHDNLLANYFRLAKSTLWLTPANNFTEYQYVEATHTWEIQ